MRLYLDAAPVIYAVEQVTPYAAAVDARLLTSEVVQVASDLTRMECRVKPLMIQSGLIGGGTGEGSLIKEAHGSGY